MHGNRRDRLNLKGPVERRLHRRPANHLIERHVRTKVERERRPRVRSTPLDMAPDLFDAIDPQTAEPSEQFFWCVNDCLDDPGLTNQTSTTSDEEQDRRPRDRDPQCGWVAIVGILGPEQELFGSIGWAEQGELLRWEVEHRLRPFRSDGHNQGARARRFYERRAWSARGEISNDELQLVLTEYRLALQEGEPVRR